jgi:hypothetical protein
VDLGCADRHKLESNRPTIIMGHAVLREYIDIIPGLDLLPGRQADRVSLYDLLGEGLGCLPRGGRLEGGEDLGGGGVFELGVEGIKEPWCRCRIPISPYGSGCDSRKW